MKVRSSAFDSTASAVGGGGDTTLPLGHDAYVQEIPRSTAFCALVRFLDTGVHRLFYAIAFMFLRSDVPDFPTVGKISGNRVHTP